tara:strand:+ start:209 stop:1255 length:1047 start_codon:yes stop_codon:yes gene_type:complete
MKKLKMVNKEINAEIIADSVNKNGNRITTFVLTYPRFIHAELLTHRLFSRNAASSRAIPASKMIKDIEEDPFIPVAWQKAHSGMQGTEYIDVETAECFPPGDWLEARDHAVDVARMMVADGVTKQIVNRILEPYQWYTCIVTATEYDNFFELRCPQYRVQEKTDVRHKSWKDASEAHDFVDPGATDLDKLQYNEGQGEIHISLLAEAMWDARNESEPKQLKAGEWHIPFGDKIEDHRVPVPEFSTAPSEMTNTYNTLLQEAKIKIATARCARVSYLNFEGKDDYEADIKLYDRLKDMGHWSPFEHCAKVPEGRENLKEAEDEFGNPVMIKNDIFGNFRGFIQLRKEIE